MENRYQMYLNALKYPFKKLTRLEFLQPDDSVAFSLDNNFKRGYASQRDSRAFIQSGNLNVSLQNGMRRKASVTLSNIDNAFSYSINNLWYGKRVRLSMGMVLPDGSDFYLPQGVFYLSNPSENITPSQNVITYSLVDKWAYLDGSLFGILPSSFKVESGSHVFYAIKNALALSMYDLQNVTSDPLKMIDSTTPVFPSYYNTQPSTSYTYTNTFGQKVTKTVRAYETAFETLVPIGGKLSELILKLNSTIVGLIGYDPTGALRIEPSQEDIDDSEKPVLWSFSRNDFHLTTQKNTIKNTEVYNDIIVKGSGMQDEDVFGRATNYDLNSDTNVNLIGLKTKVEDKAEYWKAEQCISYAKWFLKRKTALQKSISIQCTQMFHLLENRLIEIERSDKTGSPKEKHIIQSLSIPLAESGEMTIGAVSVNDFSDLTVTSSNDITQQRST